MSGCMIILKEVHNYFSLEGSAPYGGFLLAPAEGWWPTATWEGPSGHVNGWYPNSDSWPQAHRIILAAASPLRFNSPRAVKVS